MTRTPRNRGAVLQVGVASERLYSTGRVAATASSWFAW
jgi:hypothetical protein